jgi:glucans biosynthesis protein C
MKRRHDIDALRALAFGLLILYHLAMLYVTDWDWHLKSSYLSETLQVPMLIVNRWRMDLIFLISGISTAFMLSRSSVREFLKERSYRLLVPLVFGTLVVVPIQPYCQGVANSLVEPGFLTFLGRYYTGYHWPPKAFDGWQYGFTWNHLWYLAYLFCYTVVLAALQWPFASRVGMTIRDAFRNLRGWRLLIWPAAPLLIFTVVLQPHFPQTHDLIHDWYAHATYFTMFLYGVWLGNDSALWRELARLRRQALLLAVAAYALYALIRAVANDDSLPHAYFAVWILRNLYIWAALCAILGWGHTLLNRPFRWLSRATESVYPWYVLHQSLIVLLAYWLVPLKLGAIWEPLLVGGGTVLGCWVFTSCVIARTNLLRPLFGMKKRSMKVVRANANA